MGRIPSLSRRELIAFLNARRKRRDRKKAAIVSPAALALIREPSGLSLSFTDTHFLASTSHYGSARVKDTGTPGNNYNSHPYGLLSYPGASVKLCRGPTGLMRYGAQNLVLQSEDFAIGSWPDLITGTGLVPVRTGGYAAGPFGRPAYRIQLDLDGGTTASDISGLRQLFTAVVGFEYQPSYWLRSTDGVSSYVVQIINSDGSADNITVTGEWKRFDASVTLAAFTSVNISVRLRGGQTPTNSDTADILVGAIQLRRLPSDPTYLKTTSSAVYELPYEWDVNGNPLGIRVEEQRSNLFLNNRAPVTQNIAVTAQAYTLSFYGTGSITLSGAHSATLNGTGANDRVTLTFTPTAGTLTCTVSGTLDFVQVEAGSFATSPIETAGSTVTRAADNISLAKSEFPRGTGVTLMGEVREPLYSTLRWIISLGDATGNSNLFINGNNIHAQAIATNINASGAHGFASPLLLAAAGFESGNTAVAVNGTIVGTNSDEALLTNAALKLGALSSIHYLNSHLARVIVLPRRMSNVELQEITS